MSDDVSQRLDSIVERLQGIEKALSSIDSRLAQTEQVPTQPIPPIMAPPPVQPVPLPTYVPQPHHEPSAPSAPPFIQPAYVPPQSPTSWEMPPASKPKPEQSTEYLIGAKLLPWVGSLLVILGISFLVAWGFSNGYITKQMMFAGEIVLSLAFVGMGQWHRNTREQYGQLLTGIGLAGLYMILVGGYTVYKLYSGNVVVELTFAVSLAMLALGWLRSWPSLWVLGLIGGFYCSTMPLTHSDLNTGVAINVIVTLAGAALAVRLKGIAYSVFLWIGSLFAFLPALDLYSQSDNMLIGALASGIICMGAFLLAAEELDGTAFFPGFVATSLGLLAIRPDRPIFLASLLTATAALGLVRQRQFFKTQVGLGVILAGLLIPWCYNWEPRTQAMAALSMGFAAVSFFIFKRSSLLASVLLLVDGSISVHASPSRIEQHPLMLVPLLAASVLCLAATVAHFRKADEVRVSYGMGLFIVVWAYSTELIAQLVHGGNAGFAMSAVWGGLAGFALISGFLFKLQEFRYASFALLGITVAKVLLYDLSDMDAGFRVAILLALGILMLIAGYAYVKQKSRAVTE